MKAKRLATDALCAALYVVLSNLAGLNLGNMKLSLDGLAILLGALLFGPVDGLIIGLLGNFVSQLTGPYGLSVTTPLWMLPPGLVGLLAGLYARKKDFSLKTPALAVLVLFCLLADTTVTTGVMWIDCLVMRYSFATYVPGIVWRYLADFIKAAVYTLLLPPLIGALRRLRT